MNNVSKATLGAAAFAIRSVVREHYSLDADIEIESKSGKLTLNTSQNIELPVIEEIKETFKEKVAEDAYLKVTEDQVGYLFYIRYDMN